MFRVYLKKKKNDVSEDDPKWFYHSASNGSTTVWHRSIYLLLIVIIKGRDAIEAQFIILLSTSGRNFITIKIPLRLQKCFSDPIDILSAILLVCPAVL